MRIPVVVGTVVVGLAVAASGAPPTLQIQYNFEPGNVSGTTVTNLGAWGTGWNGTLNNTLNGGVPRGHTEAVVDAPSVSQWGKPVGAVLVGLAGDMLHVKTNVDTGIAPLFDYNGTGFYVANATGSDVNNTISFWMKFTSGLGQNFVGTGNAQEYIAGGTGEAQNRTYDGAGARPGQTWYVAPGGNWGSPRLLAFNDYANWHFYSLSFSNSASDTKIYRDGVFLGQMPGNSGRYGGWTDVVGLRIGGEEDGGVELFMDSLSFMNSVISNADAAALFDAQFFVPEPTVALLLLAGASVLGLRRRRN